MQKRYVKKRLVPLVDVSEVGWSGLCTGIPPLLLLVVRLLSASMTLDKTESLIEEPDHLPSVSGIHLPKRKTDCNTVHLKPPCTGVNQLREIAPSFIKINLSIYKMQLFIIPLQKVFFVFKKCISTYRFPHFIHHMNNKIEVMN